MIYFAENGYGSTVENHLFSSEQIAVLRNTVQWRLVASGLPEELPSQENESGNNRDHDIHPYHEAVIILSGTGRHALGSKTYSVSTGNIILIDAMEKHWHDYTSGDQLWFQFLPEGVCIKFASIEKGYKRGNGHFQWERSYPLTGLGLTCAQPLFPNTNTKAPPEAIRGRCLSVFGMLLSALIEKGYRQQPNFPQDSVQGNIISSIVKHIQESCGRNCTLDNLSRLAGFSPFHFSRLFGKYTGMSLSECVNAARISGFQRMISDGKALKDITVELGFSHPSALSRWRRRQGI